MDLFAYYDYYNFSNCCNKMNDELIPLTGEQEIQKSKLLTLFEQNILTPLKKIFKSESKTVYGDVIIRNSEGKILLLHRGYADGFMSGKWGFPGGHIESNETPLQGAQREAEEETGICVNIRPVEVKEKQDCILHYFEALLMSAEGSPLSSSIILDNNEHRGYEWVEPMKVKEYDLVADLRSYVDDLIYKLVPITIITPKYTNIEEQIAMEGGGSSLDEAWQVLQKAFDENQIDEERFMKAKELYDNAKIKEAKELIAKAFDAGLISEERYMEAMQKGGDPSHGGKLIKKKIVQTDGKVTTKWVDPHTGEAPEKVKTTKAPAVEQWWSKYKEHQLNCYPVNIDKSKVDVDVSGDVHSHWILRWKDPKSGAIKNAYSKEFLQRNAELKWARIQNVSSRTVDTIKQGSKAMYQNDVVSEATKQAAAIINIIAHTGLRRGDKLKFEKTGNRGVSSLLASDISIEGSKVKFNFTGKSYQENVAEVDDKDLATFLAYRKKQKGPKDFLFDTSDPIIDATFDKVGGEGLKIKDMRTYVASDLARKLLFEDPSSPPPLPKDLSETKQKKLIQDKLKGVYEQVSQKLNNTPAMAKNSYIHPNIIDFWIKKLNVNFEIKKGEEAESGDSLDDIIAAYPYTQINLRHIDSDDEEMCDTFNEPEWFEDLVK